MCQYVTKSHKVRACHFNSPPGNKVLTEIVIRPLCLALMKMLRSVTGRINCEYIPREILQPRINVLYLKQRLWFTFSLH
jgi:hypothetical protein